MDISLLIIKPEIFNRKREVFEFLKNYGFDILISHEYRNWSKFAQKIYIEYTTCELQCYLNGYINNCFGDKFCAAIVSHNRGQTVTRLKNIQGHYHDYQNEIKDTLRSKFGFGGDLNLSCGERIFTFSGIHCVENESELRDTLKLLEMLYNYANS